MIVSFNRMQKELAENTVTRQELQQTIRQQTQQLRILSETDALTGIGNRRLFDRHLKQAASLAYRQHQSIALLMIDVDGFKLYNDHYGHQNGDRVLTQVAQLIEAAVPRETDFSARYGGEEFVVLLTDTHEKGALKVAERIRAGIELKQIPHQPIERGYMTASIGVAAKEWHEANQDLLQRHADEAMYQAKQAGKNCVVLYLPMKATEEEDNQH